MVEDFLKAIVRSKYEALGNSLKKSDSLRDFLLLKATAYWIEKKEHYEGEIPGHPGSFVSLHKSESGYDGTIHSGPIHCDFKKANLYELASIVDLSIGAKLDLPKVPQNHLKALSVSLNKYLDCNFADDTVRKRKLLKHKITPLAKSEVKFTEYSTYYVLDFPQTWDTAKIESFLHSIAK